MHITYLYACTDDKSVLFCSSKLNGQVIDRALVFLWLPPSLSLCHPRNSFCFFPSPWLLTLFYDSLFSSLAFFFVLSAQNLLLLNQFEVSASLYRTCFDISPIVISHASISISPQSPIHSADKSAAFGYRNSSPNTIQTFVCGTLKDK